MTHALQVTEIEAARERLVDVRRQVTKVYIGEPAAVDMMLVALLARGRTNRQIGEELYISGKTASVHVSNILAKLSAASRTEAVAVAYREGLIEP